jgi:PAS domain S-box-containing protein
MMNPQTRELPRLADVLIEQAPDAVIFADPQGCIRLWNAAAQRIFGFAKRDAIGANLDILIPEKFRDAHWQGFARALAARSTKYTGQVLTTRSQRADGAKIYVDLGFSIVLDDNGDVLGVLAHARDVTQRIEKQRAAGGDHP